jgi:hypothetical protein
MFVSSKLQYYANEWQMHVSELGFSYFLPHEFLIISRGEFLILSRGEKYHLPVPFLVTCKRTVNSWAWSVSNIKIHSGHSYF